MVKFIRELFGHYKSYHVHGPRMLWYAGIMGAVAFPAFYLLRFTKSELPYDDLYVRLVAAVLCLALLLKNQWPRRWQRYYLAYSYVALAYTLPMAFMFTSLKNGGGTIAVANTLMAAFFVVLMTDWRNTIAMLLLGFGSAIALYAATDPAPTMPMDYIARLPVLVLVIVGGCFFKLAANQAVAEKMRQGYASIAGSIAHEVRNPLGQVRYSLQGMQDALPAPGTGAAEQTLTSEAIDTLYRHLADGEVAVRRGLQLISMTLDEVSAKPLDAAAFSYLSAADVARKAVEEYGYETGDGRERVALRVAGDFSFRGDETAFVFVLFNLIKNALFYVPLYPALRVTVTVDAHRVQVRDSGPGIHAEALARLFEPFSSVGKAGGTGLGLAYCQRVMRSFGGEIGCESVPGVFTEFTLTFPPIAREESEAWRLALLARAQQAFHGKRFLVVDDDATLRMTTRHKLQPLGVAIDEAGDGLQALELLGQRTYDMVVLDLNMPLLDGYALTGRIRGGTVPANRDVRIVAYTSEAPHVASVKTHKAGMDGFVSKPSAQLPLVQALLAVMAAPVASAPIAVLSGRTVLLADDSPYSRKVVAAYLAQAGVQVVEAGHGQAVLDALAARDGWDAVLMDISMPGMNGFEVTRAMRRGAPPLRDVPVIALTAHFGEAMAQAAREAGMSAFLTKPVDARLLYEKLGQAIAGRPGWTAPPAASVPAPPPVGESVLLDLRRLEGLARLNMLGEVVGGYLPAMERMVTKLQGAVGRHDLPESSEVLHSLLGMSGEVGASALYQLLREVYVPVCDERRWPANPDWLARVTSLLEQTDRAARAYCAAVDVSGASATPKA